ncbi:hypothetical protein V6N13_122067 [Hibiscus sabdariffa]
MPYTDDRSLITCGGDGQVRLAQISECGVETRLLAKHQCNASDLAFEPGSPHLIYTCGEDSLVQHIDIRTAAAIELLRCQPICGCRVQNPVISLHAITIDPRNPNVFAVVRSDQYARLYDIRKYKCGGFTGYCKYKCGGSLYAIIIDLRTAADTKLLRCQPICGCRVRNPVISLYAIAIDPRNPNVFAVVGSNQYARLYDICKYKCGGSTDFGQPIDYFYPPHVIVSTNAISYQGELLVSYRDNLIYLFTRDMGLGHNLVPSSPSSSCSEANGKDIPQVYKGHGKKETDSVSFFGPKSEFVVSESGNGRVYIWKKKCGELVCAKKEHVLGVDCIESHPHTTVLASSGADGIKIWAPNAIDKAMLPATKLE